MFIKQSGPFFAAVCCLWIGLNVLSVEPMEQDILRRSTQAVGSLPGLVDKPVLSVSGRDVLIGGVAFAPESSGESISVVRSLAGPRNIAAELVPLPRPAGPFFFSAAAEGIRFALRGNVSLPGVRSHLVNEAHDATAADVVDELTYAAGAPKGFQSAAQHGLRLAAQLDGGRFSLADNVYSLSGRAIDAASHQMVMASLSRLPAQVVRGSIAIAPPEAEPYAWRVIRRGDRVELSGPVEDESRRGAVMAEAAARLPGLTIGHDLPLSHGVSPTGPTLLDLGVSLLDFLTSGEVVATAGKVSIIGMLKPDGAEAAVRERAGGLPVGWSLGEVALRPYEVPPPPVSIAKADGVIRLSGQMTAATHVRARRQLAQVLLGEAVVDETREAAGADPVLADALDPLLVALSRLVEGRALVEGQIVSLRGTAIVEPAALEVVQMLQGALPAGYRLDATVGVQSAAASLEAGACQSELDLWLARGSLRFETGSATLDTTSLALVDGLGMVLRRCPEATAEIGGHTDSVGPADFNLELSRQRAQAVLTRLHGLGVAGERLSAIGYGETKPVATNEDEDGRARNRRIEIVIR